jgi:hypothetical protein
MDGFLAVKIDYSVEEDVHFVVKGEDFVVKDLYFVV